MYISSEMKTNRMIIQEGGETPPLRIRFFEFKCLKIKIKKVWQFFVSLKLYTYLSFLFIVLSLHGSVKSEQKSIYQNNYWGFIVKYPKDWYACAGTRGDAYYFESYDSKDLDASWYIPNQDQLRIEVSIIPKDVGIDYKNAPPEYIIKKQISR
ncbi:MAG: hypothetical protein AB1498_07180 [bacterium]